MELITKYAILKRTTELQEYISEELLPNGGGEMADTVTRVAGTLVKLYKEHATAGATTRNGKTAYASSVGSGGGGSSIVQILDFINKVPHYENLYKCSHMNLQKVSEDLFPYIICIAEPERRLRCVQNKNVRSFAIYLKKNDVVRVNGEQFGRKNVRYDCIIRYIGPVEEYYPVGYIFGLELLNLINGPSPQSEDIPYAIKYMQCDPSLSIFTTIDWISPLLNDETKKKFTTLGLVTDAFEKVRSAIAPSGGCLSSTGTATTPQSPFTPVDAATFPTRTPSTRKAKKKKTATAQFYTADAAKAVGVAPATARATEITQRGRTPSPACSDFDLIEINNTPTLSTTTTTVTTIAATTPIATNTTTMERNSNLASDNVNSQALIVLENDDFKQSVENYERSLERQYANSNSITTITINNSNANPSTLMMGTSNASSQTIMPAGILKHRSSSTNTNNSGSGSGSGSANTTIATGNNVNKSVIMSLPDRDIIVIDKADIRESMRNEGSVIVVNRQPLSMSSTSSSTAVPSSSSSLSTAPQPLPHAQPSSSSTSTSALLTNTTAATATTNTARQQDVDLADLLGSRWPHAAGSAATILNKNNSSTHDNSNCNSVNSGGSGGGSGYSTIERNKSPNPLQHIANSYNNNNNNNNSNSNSNSNTLTRLKTLERKREIGLGTTATATTTNETHTEANTKISKSSRRNSLVNDEPPIYDNLIDLIDTDAPIVPNSCEDFIECSPLQELPNGGGLGVGSMVEVTMPHETSDEIYGVIRWIGVPPGAKSIMIGIELEEDHSDKQLLTTDGKFDGVPLFKCPEGRALFVTPDRCASDKRFLDMDNAGAVGTTAAIASPSSDRAAGGHYGHGEYNGIGAGASASAGKLNGNLQQSDCKMFGQVECPSVPGAVAPLKVSNTDELADICGKFKGIQGHHNSCYLDATLFAMFTFTSVFDSLLFRPPDAEDISHYLEVQKVLREEIVNPLRKNVFVRADRVMKLRKLLDKLSSVSGLTSEEKDPEEFLNSLLAQIMRVEPFLKLSSGQDAYFYQLFVEKDERLSFPTVQQLFEQSFHSSDIKLKEVPSCLIIQMPRFGKNFKMYPRILPSQVLDVTDIIEDSPRQCTVCGKLAEFECRDCFGFVQGVAGLESTALCHTCLETVHMHAKRANHTWKRLSVPQDFRIMAEHMSGVSRLFMELFAVVCIETSHYVAFVKAGSGPDAPWCFFDSMADRKGEKNGYNIPEMITVPDLPLWLSDDGARNVNETSTNDKMLPEHAKRLFCDAYMCMYQSTDVMMYR